jgi:ribose transport system ATP-binding protein
MTNSSAETILELRNVTKGLYDSSGRTISKDVIVLDSVNFDVRQGEVHVLLGENGAGKSTLMKILCGAVPADSGEILLYGKQVHIDRPRRAHELGVSLVTQEFSLCPNLSVAENTLLGREPASGPFGRVDATTRLAETQRYLGRLGVDVDPRAMVKDLNVPQRQVVEIAKALSHNPKILVMDEPTASLADDQVDQLFAIIRELTRQKVSIVYISHRLNELKQIGDRVTVLRDGQTIGTLDVAEADLDVLIQMMVGRTISNMFPRDVCTPGAMALEVSHLERRGVLHDVNLTVREGEIVGLAGIAGAGRTELARAIFGADPRDAGDVRVFGRPLKGGSPAESIACGLGLLPEDRQRHGLVALVSVADNTVHVAMNALAWHGWLGHGARRRAAAGFVKDLDMAVSSLDQEARFLSGGTQQKLVLAKWLCAKSKIFIFDEPTRGIDVGAKASIHELMNELAKKGAAILMISSELAEVVGMSDRIYVMSKGRIAKELFRGQTNSEEILGYAMGKHEATAPKNGVGILSGKGGIREAG